MMDLSQYHGGTNFDRIASAFVVTAYYDEAPLDEYGMFLSFLRVSKIVEISNHYVIDYAKVSRFG